MKQRNLYINLIKPLSERAISLLLLVALSPFILLIIIFLFVFNKGNVWFIQERPGLNENLFRVIKFKTMTDEVDGSGNLLPDKKRLTWVGNLVRKTSLDELPQLINVLKGEMSFVGPRPLLTEYLVLYDAHQRKRHTVKPGITGWAQINGRNAISWEAKFDFDVWYVENISFWLDLKILFLTLLKVIQSEGISSESSVTMEKFSGTK